MEWAIEVCKRTGLPVAATMCIGPEGDMHGVSAEDCAVRMAKAGADIGKIYPTIIKKTNKYIRYYTMNKLSHEIIIGNNIELLIFQK